MKSKDSDREEGMNVICLNEARLIGKNVIKLYLISSHKRIEIVKNDKGYADCNGCTIQYIRY